MEDQKKPISHHLVDLRNLLVKIGSVWLVGTGLVFLRGSYFQELITKPLGNQQLHFLSPTDSLFYLLKIYFFFGLLLGLPLILYFIWSYVTPILKTQEKKFSFNYLFSGFILAAIAILYGYYWLLPTSLEVLLGIRPDGTNILLTASDYLDFAIGMAIVVLIVFQLPLITYSLIKSKIVSLEFFQKQRRVVYLTLVAIMAVLTPTPDAFSLILITVPVLILYEVALVLSKL